MRDSSVQGLWKQDTVAVAAQRWCHWLALRAYFAESLNLLTRHAGTVRPSPGSATLQMFEQCFPQ